MNPVLPPGLLFPLIAIAICGAAWLAWKSSASAPAKLRRVLLTLRIAALLLLAVFLVNPGQWRAMDDQVARVWAIMIDRSGSMSVTEDGPDGGRRIDQALTVRDQITERAEAAGVELRYFSYDQSVAEEDGAATITAEGTASDLTTAADSLLTRFSAQGEPLAGVFVLSDGRQTHVPRHSNFALRAQALQVPFHTIPIGGNQETPDLALQVPRRTITAFPGQNVQITAVLESRGMPTVQTDLLLLDAAGSTLETVSVTVNPEEQAVHTFSLKAPGQSAMITLQLPAREDELRLSNNSAEVRIRILNDKAKVFIAEGAPYWDSKFLAQLLRQQKHMDVVSVHRLSEARWFRIDSGESKPHESDIDVFPDTREELMAYDLIIFGKNSEHFLTPERIALLRTFVSDQGGAVLFSRSKPYTGLMPDLAPLDPVTWKTGLTGEFRMRPTTDGQASGLFGQALPAPDSSVWQTLPLLKDAHRIDVVKPFTRVLANGEMGNASTQGTFPLLLVRRYGQGVSGLVNADGLWKWDFFPEARELGNMYEEFWIQMIHWMLAYSEFLPGQEFSLNLSASIVDPDTPVALRISYRGAGQPIVPQIEVTSPLLPAPLRLAPAEIPSEDGRLKWGANFTPELPGTYQLRLVRPEGTSPPPPTSSLPEVIVTVQPPPGEMDEPSADPAFLAAFADLSGGKLAPDKDLRPFLDEVIQPSAPESRDQGVEWHPSWMHWISPILVLLFLALEWWLRRRNGLV